VKNRIGTLVVCGSCAVFGSAGVSAAETGVKWEFATGVDYSSGDYGGDVDTDILYVPFTLRAQGERLKFELTAPYMRLEGPSNVVGGSGSPIVIDPPQGNPSQGSLVTNSGLGDVVAGLGYSVPQLSDGGPFLELKTKMKIATAADGLGTDETDYSVQIDAYQMVGGKFTLFGGLGYQWLGDPTGLKLEDGLIGTLGFNLKAGPATDIGLLLDHRRESFAGLDDQRTLIPYVSWRTAKSLGLTLYGVFGMTETSPDYGAGLQFTYSP
jgi:hypothetical protein